MFIILFPVYGTIIIVPALVHSVFCIYQGNFDTSTWYFSNKMTTPFDFSTVSGWYMTLLTYAVGAIPCFSIMLATMSFMVCSCYYIQATCNHFQVILGECDAIVSARSGNEIEKSKIISEKMKAVVSQHIDITE